MIIIQIDASDINVDIEIKFLFLEKLRIEDDRLSDTTQQKLMELLYLNRFSLEEIVIAKNIYPADDNFECILAAFVENMCLLLQGSLGIVGFIMQLDDIKSYFDEPSCNLRKLVIRQRSYSDRYTLYK